MIRSGFTIIEVLITIAIIVLLVGITVLVSGGLARQSEVRRTESTLRLLDMALQEWEMQAERRLTWGEGPGYDIERYTEFEMVLTVVLERIRGVEDVRAILAGIDPAAVLRFEPGAPPPVWVSGGYDPADYGEITVLDAWGAPIYALHPGAPGSPPVDPDGTERTINENHYGVAANGRICFISNGPDGAEGHMAAPPDSQLFEQTTDNVYSYAVGRP